ncbi:type I restriction enzyme HsdR N-terminal domain-containing protein [Pseudomonas viridiflava]|uniref:type I restriction enzyme HsdR N-terminal domain-containing protein n=1 Tax=Pseudomonas viridiflava TaxID=33069 RepID=UPI002E988FBA|nr:type I restriction enzyme HsdR N-terminal domain-containing protein [Pseudomonas viridiflava]
MAPKKPKPLTVGKTKPTINEADFQAALIARLREALPLLPANIRAERYLHLKLGHHHIKVDGTGKGNAFRGRSDVIVFLDDKPLLLAELKAPEVPITDGDVDQGLSYARLNQPMVPLVLVTNGDPAATRLVRTYDGNPAPKDQTDAAGLSKILSAASALAASSAEGAIRKLLGSEPAVWTTILNNWNTEEISSKTGAIGDHHRACADTFQIPREAVDQVRDELKQDTGVVVLHGPPLSGTTCTMIQLVKAIKDVPALYIDRRNSGDVLQFLSAKLTRELSIGVSRDDVRQWLITGQSLAGLILLVDGIPSEELEELLHLSELRSLKLVLGTDSGTFESLRMLPGRTEETMLGRLAKHIELFDLSEDEFGAACRLLFEEKGALFFPGAAHIPDLRRPRHLRLIASQIPQDFRPEVTTSASGEDFRSCMTVPAIQGFRMLERASRLMGADARLKHDLSKLAIAYLVDISENGSDRDRIAETYGAPSIDPHILEELLGTSRLERLCSQGMIHWVDTQTLGPRLIIRFPELLAHYVSILWAAELNEQSDSEGVVVTLDRILQHSDFVPYGDLCVAYAVFRVEDGNHLTQILEALENSTPQATLAKEGAELELMATDIRGIRLHFGEGMHERLLGNLQPWLVLSHLAALPMAMGADEISKNLRIFANLGNYEDLIFKPAPSNVKDMIGLHFHDIPDVGQLLCPSSGIVEPIVQAMYVVASARPEPFEELVLYAVKEKQYFLAWRLRRVVSMLQSSVDPEVSVMAQSMTEVLDEFWKDLMLSDMEDCDE